MPPADLGTTGVESLPALVGADPRDPVDGRTRFSWALFDWAQQPYHTLVGSFFFRPYFVAVVAATPALGQAQIAFAGSLSGLLAAIAGPLVGIAIDRQRNPKVWLALSSLPFVATCIALWWAVPGGTGMVPLVLSCLVVSALAAEVTTTVNNAMLPAIARPGKLGQLSGDAVALGFLGGIASTILVLAVFFHPNGPSFGLDKALHEPERIIGPFVAVWYLLFVLPLFLTYPARAAARTGASPLKELWQLAQTLPHNPPIFKFLIARMLVADALNAVQLFAGIIATTTFNWDAASLGTYGLLVLASAALGSMAGGRIDDWLSARVSVLVNCGLLFVGVVGLMSVRPDHVFFAVPVAPPTPGGEFLGATSEIVFLGFALILGFASGPLTGSMRTWMVQLSRVGEEGRWFGLYSLAGRATAFLAPLVIGLATLVTGDVGMALPVIFGFLIAGWAVFALVPASMRDSRPS